MKDIQNTDSSVSATLSDENPDYILIHCLDNILSIVPVEIFFNALIVKEQPDNREIVEAWINTGESITLVADITPQMRQAWIDGMEDAPDWEGNI